MRRDPLIIGAGPAGAAAAIMLSRAGLKPVILEKAPGPVDKVCGDFLSDEGVRQARVLGVDPATLGAAPIRQVRVVSGRRLAEASLPFPAFGLSRRVFDETLAKAAEGSGAILQNRAAVRRLSFTQGRWVARRADGIAFSTETVFLATGKHDLRDQPRDGARGGWIGLKTYLALSATASAALRETTELTLFPGGYAGLQGVENERTVLCVAISRKAFQAYDGDWNGLLEAIGRHTPHFAAMIDGARFLLPRPMAVAGIPYGYRASAAGPDGLFRLGDQAAVIPSLTGDGVAIALHTGTLAAQAFLANETSAAYQRRMAAELAPQMRLAGIMHGLGTRQTVQDVALSALRRAPGLLQRAARFTRLRHALAEPG